MDVLGKAERTDTDWKCYSLRKDEQRTWSRFGELQDSQKDVYREVGGKRVTMNQMFFTQLRLCMLLNPHTLPPVVRPEVMIYVERKH
ncbi:hypothetical protein NQZ68_020731 [Dissostichus eleginoides]|nr:hypothetical protein NQZ68_020731 [Dissostichus eleginoides]